MHNLAEFFQVKNSIRFEREWKDLICTVFGVSKEKENYLNEKFTAPIRWRHCYPCVKKKEHEFFKTASMGRKF